MKLSELFTATGSPFFYYPGFVKRFDISVNATVFLCFLGWKTIPDTDGWRAFNASQIEDETGLSAKEQASARKRLAEVGLIEERYARLEHKLWFRITGKDLEIGNGQTPKGQMGNCPNVISTIIGKESLKESTCTSETGKTEETEVCCICSREEAVASTMTCGIPDEFSGFVYDDWSSRGGKDGSGVAVKFVPYACKRWAREQVDWKAGTHKGTAKSKPRLADIQTKLKALREYVQRLRDEHPEEPRPENVRREIKKNLLEIEALEKQTREYNLTQERR